jgi:hypothetical protein
VGRIDKISLAVAAIVGLFGILYFSLAPAAMSTEVKIGGKQLPGYTCQMIASITRDTTLLEINGVGLGTALTRQESDARISKFNSQFQAFAVSSGLIPLFFQYPTYNGPPIFDLLKLQLRYKSSLFDTYDDCIAAARVTACKFTSSKLDIYRNYNVDGDPGTPLCTIEMLCSDPSGTIETDPIRFDTNNTILANPAVGQCNNQANVSSCLNIGSNCASLERFRAGFEDIFRKVVLTPEALCEPFVKNPPYICTKSLPPSVPSILSQALAFFISALAAAKTALFFSAEMRHKCHNKAPSKDDGGPGTNGDDKSQKGASKPSDISVEMRPLTE